MTGSARFKIVHKVSGGGEEYATVHQRGCTVDSGERRWIDAHEAWVALSDGVPGCAYCRPDDVLGFDDD
ncbi:DUF6233 domain-containing protein [Streptomyces spinosisporus]|uniref:DUF6233 domain-containing protein n=1 Tax=Streptomyces spinosisporus TaxID=2927582 RepID=A0ABS9XE55_9ACTN|nr:DUF6233 domain-containing protein [Streptomyces spinosisporus]MCI3240265.1 DUF6233 domain-containing protein [Streptomyces spinosisporus]